MNKIERRKMANAIEENLRVILAKPELAACAFPDEDIRTNILPFFQTLRRIAEGETPEAMKERMEMESRILSAAKVQLADERNAGVFVDRAKRFRDRQEERFKPFTVE